MKTYGQLEYAQLHNLVANPSAGKKGLAWFNTTDGRVYIDNGTVVSAALLNDDKAIIGTSGTAANNVRLHRAAVAVLQLVLGNDVTAEGTLSTALAMLSHRIDGYTNAAKPAAAAGNVGRLIYITDGSRLELDLGGSWAVLAPSGQGGGGEGKLWGPFSRFGPEAGVDDVPFPLETDEYYHRVLIYPKHLTTAAGDAGAVTTVRVPSNYASGRQINLKILAYSSSITGNFFFQADTYLERPGTHAASTSIVNLYSSTNVALANSATANMLRSITLDLTNASGVINGTAVAAGDILRVVLRRYFDTDVQDIRFIPSATEVTFS